MGIPIKNIYYLLSYAWNKLDAAERLEIDASDYRDAINLLARVLLNGSKLILKKGLDKEYLEITEEYNGIKGKINFKESLHKNLFAQGKAVCSFDAFTANILQNQILKSTLRNLTRSHLLDAKLEAESWDLFHRFHGIAEIELGSHHFAQVKIHRNNQAYDFVLKVAQLIHEHLVLNEETGSYHFHDFTRDPKAMAALFEAFVRKFYSLEQHQYRVRREDIRWDAKPIGNSDINLLPKMQTDITLESPVHKIILDTKYYQETLSRHFKHEKIHSQNLYQMFAYLSNLEAKDSDPNNQHCSGILLYPTTQRELDERFQMGQHQLKIATVDLSQDWSVIHERLLDVISERSRDTKT